MPNATLSPVLAEPARRKITLDEFHGMRQAGIFAEHDRVELRDGELWDSCPSHAPSRVKLTAEQYYELGETGVFDEDDRMELLDGELYEMMAPGRWHEGGVNALTMGFAGGGGGQRVVSVQNSVHLAIRSAPQPDVVVLQFRADYYRSRHAEPADVLLVVEVADTSMRHDRVRKLPLYAEAGVAEVWIVTRRPAAIEVYRSPIEGRYTVQRTYLPGETICAEAIPEVVIAVSDVTG